MRSVAASETPPPIQGLKRMIAPGGFSILSRLAIADEVRAGTLVACELRSVELSRELRAVRLAGAPPPDRPASRRFWAWLAARALTAAARPAPSTS